VKPVPDHDDVPLAQEIAIHPWIAMVQEAISGASPAGVAADELDVFNDIETEMMKRGTTSQSEIRWSWVGDNCRTLLERESKDFRLVGYLLLALSREVRSIHDIAVGIHLLRVFSETWQQLGYPSGRKRHAGLTTCVTALHAMAEAEHKLQADSRSLGWLTAEFEAVTELLSAMAPALADRMAPLCARIQSLTGLPQQTQQDEIPVSAAASGLKMREEPAQAPAPAVAEPDLKELARSWIATADILLDRDPASPASYALRRHAVWSNVVTPPQVLSETTVSVIKPPSRDVVHTYLTAIGEQRTDPAMIRRLERSLTIQPFWLGGHFIAHQLASIMRHATAAAVIRYEVQQFVARCRWAGELQFADGTPFLSDETRQWLEAATLQADPVSCRTKSTPAIAIAAPPEPVAGVLATNRPKSIETILLDIERTFPKNDDPRMAALSEITALEALAERGLRRIVAPQAQRLGRAIAQMKVSEWEPDMVKRLAVLQRS
jgi:type VI secretion system protein VasJ